MLWLIVGFVNGCCYWFGFYLEIVIFVILLDELVVLVGLVSCRFVSVKFFVGMVIFGELCWV